MLDLLAEIGNLCLGSAVCLRGVFHLDLQRVDDGLTLAVLVVELLHPIRNAGQQRLRGAELGQGLLKIDNGRQRVGHCRSPLPLLALADKRRGCPLCGTPEVLSCDLE